MGDWPEVKTQPCQWCKQPITLTRKGESTPDRRGRPGYWYTSEHRCEEGERIGRALKATQARIEQALSKPRKKSS